MREVYESEGNVFAGYLQDMYPHQYEQGVWIFTDFFLTRIHNSVNIYSSKRFDLFDR